MNTSDRLAEYSRIGNLEECKKIVENNVHLDINHKFLCGGDALVWASYKEHVEIIQYFVEKRANINFQDTRRFTSLMWISVKGHIDITKYLIKNGANVHCKDDYRVTALSRVFWENYSDIVELLVKNGSLIDDNCLSLKYRNKLKRKTGYKGLKPLLAMILYFL